MYHSNILYTSADIDTQIEQNEQGIMNVETAFCNPNFVSFIVHPRFPVYHSNSSASAAIDTQIQ